MSSVPSAVMIRRAGGLSERMMTGQPPGAKHSRVVIEQAKGCSPSTWP